MRRDERRDVWVIMPNGTGCVVQVLAYPMGDTDLCAYRDESTGKWHVVDSSTGMCSGRTYRTRKEVWADLDVLIDIYRRFYRVKDRDAMRRELAAAAAENMRLAEEWKALGRERQAQREALPAEAPVEVIDEVPVDAYADVDAHRKPSKRDRDAENFRRDYGQLYIFLEDSAKRDEHVGDVLLMQHVLTLSGARWTREHPRMYRKLCRWHGDAFTSDRELAALAMWVERSIERESAKTAA